MAHANTSALSNDFVLRAGAFKDTHVADNFVVTYTWQGMEGVTSNFETRQKAEAFMAKEGGVLTIEPIIERRFAAA